MKTIELRGRRVAYDDAGTGTPALVFTHGWCASREQLAPLLPHLTMRSLLVDSRGHGDTEAGTGDFGRRELVEEVEAVIEASGASSVVPVAVAHSGWIALDLCRALGERIAGVVLLDWIVLDPPAPFLGALGALQREDAWEPTRARLFQMWTEGVESDAARRFVSSVMGAHGFPMWARAGREIARAYAEHGNPLKAFAALPKPPRVLHLYAQPASSEYLGAQRAFAAEHPWFSVARLEGARSHFPYFEMPAVVAGEVQAFARGLEDRRNSSGGRGIRG